MPLSVFELACENGDFKAVKSMLDEGNCSVYLGMSRACIKGHVKIVEMLVEWSPIQDMSKCALIACHYGHVEIVKLLVPRVIVTDYKYIDRCMLMTSTYGQLEVLKYLMSIGGGINLVIVCSHGHVSLVEFIYEKIKNSDRIIEILDNCIRVVSQKSMPILNRHVEVVRFLISKGGSVEYLEKTHNFKLYCIYCRHMKIEPQTDWRMMKLVKKYPVFSLLFKKNGPTKRLPIEMMRLLHACF